MLKKIFPFLPLILAISVFTLALYFVRVKSLNKVAGISTSSQEKNIKGIILPHHNLAKEYINLSIEKISQKSKFSTIVIIGPNHFEGNFPKFKSTLKLFDYPLLEKPIYQLYDLGLLILDGKTLSNEHSISVPISYLYKFFPDAKFIPIISPFYFNKKEISEIAKFLTKNLPEDTLYVASVDFSHEKMLLEAMEKNKETESAIANFDYQKIYKFKDDHTDSPATLGLLLNVMQNLGSTNWELWYNSHGALIEDRFDLQGTSYLLGVFSN